MKGREAIVAALTGSGVRVCFANPGTSEMHFVAALDRYPRMRGVLCLSESVATGAADGYGRMTGHPAATLLHLGPGLANGLANLHNARRAGTPVVNVVGDHSAAHKLLDAAGDSDIDPVAASVSAWLSRPADAASLGRDVAEAVAASLDWSRDTTAWTGTPGSVSTVIAAADLSWSDDAEPAAPIPIRPARSASPEAMKTVEKALSSGEPAALRGVRHLVLAGARPPVAPFGYPGVPGELTPPGVQVHELAGEFIPVSADLLALADRIAPDKVPRPAGSRLPAPPSGPLTRRNWASVIGRLLPQEAIVCDEAITSGLGILPEATMGAAPHDTLGLVGLAIGQGLPLAVGAAVACPGRPVICLEADGSAMYTISALWTMARENLNVTTVILSNRSYAILRAELARTGVRPGGGGAVRTSAADRMLDLSGPDLDFAAIGAGMGVPASRATTAEELARQFAAALAEPGPHLIDAVLTEA